jgi:hypothetical protein
MLKDENAALAFDPEQRVESPINQFLSIVVESEYQVAFEPTSP